MICTEVALQLADDADERPEPIRPALSRGQRRDRPRRRGADRAASQAAATASTRFPGGGVEAGETLDEAVRREVRRKPEWIEPVALPATAR